MNKNYISLSGLSVFYSKIKEWINSTFAEKFHPHQISDIDGLERRLDELTIPPDIDTSEEVVAWVNQLSLTVSDLTDAIAKLTPAIGEIYITTSNEHPGLKFGGVWEQIKDVFLLAAGDTYSAGLTGGESEHTLTIDEMPSHTHAYKRHEFNRTDTDPDTGEDVYGANNKTLGARMGSTEATGNGQAHNNMPPYLTVFVWKRVS